MSSRHFWISCCIASSIGLSFLRGLVLTSAFVQTVWFEKYHKKHQSEIIDRNGTDTNALTQAKMIYKSTIKKKPPTLDVLHSGFHVAKIFNANRCKEMRNLIPFETKWKPLSRAGRTFLGLPPPTKGSYEPDGQAKRGNHVRSVVVDAMSIHEKMRSISNTSSSSKIPNVEVMYIRNPKVASAWMMDGGGFSNLLNISTESFRTVDRKWRQPWIDIDEMTPDNSTIPSFVFSFVRDPIQTFFAAYKEVICRTVFFLQAAGRARNSLVRFASEIIEKKKSFSSTSSTENDPRFRSIVNPFKIHETKPKISDVVLLEQIEHLWPNITKNQSFELFDNFVDDVEEFKSLGREAFHIWPQAIKIDVGKELDFIFKVEKNFTHALHEIFPKFSGQHHNDSAHKSGGSCKTALSQINPTEHRKWIRRLCQILAIDYECFEYEKPKECA